MQVTITSTTDSKEAVIAAQGNLAQEKVVDTPAPEKVAEAATEVESSETDEGLEDESERTDEDAPKEGEEQKPKKKGGFKRKIAKIEQERDYWRQEALKPRTADTPKDPVAATAAEGEPNPEDFATQVEFAKAIAAWTYKQEKSASDKADQQQKAKAIEQDKFATHLDRVKEFAETHDDFEEVMQAAGSITIPDAVVSLLVDAENGAEILYELAKQPKEFKRICALGDIAAARELGRFESKLKSSSDSKETPEPKTTKAPKPITPLSAKGGAISKSPDDMDFDEYKAWRKKNPRG